MGVLAPETRGKRRRMVASQLAARGVRDARVLAAMAWLPREWFLPPHLAAEAYDDAPLPIGSGQTISQPYIVALMTAALAPRRGERVLIESFAAGGSTPLELCAIPRRHADLNRSRRRRFVSKERATCRQQAHRSKGGQACAETSVDVSSRHHPQRAPTGGWRSALSAGRWRSLNRRGSGVNGLRDPDSPPAAPFRTQRPGRPSHHASPPEVEVDRIRDAEAAAMTDHLREHHAELGLSRAAALGDVFEHYRVTRTHE